MRWTHNQPAVSSLVAVPNGGPQASRSSRRFPFGEEVIAFWYARSHMAGNTPGVYNSASEQHATHLIR